MEEKKIKANPLLFYFPKNTTETVSKSVKPLQHYLMNRDIELDENITRYIENRNNFVEFRKMRRFDLNNWSVPTNEIINISRTFLYDLIDENLAVAE